MSSEATTIASAAAPQVNADSPWPGLLSFSEQDAQYFKGRDSETDDLLRLVLRERLTVLFGVSGLGKSSLLQAGLFPRLRPENVFPVYIRFDFSPAKPDLVAQVFSAISRDAERITNGPDKRRVEVPPVRDGEKLWEYFHRQGNNSWNERNRLLMPLLVFDQFEEVFTLGRQDADRLAATRVFLEQLADLVEGRPPAALKAWIDEHPEEASAFDFERDYYKVLLGIREDFLPELEALRPRMPRIALNRLRLRRMNGEAALLVVNQAHNIIDPDVGERVVRFVAADPQSELKDLQIEPALLSVFCSELNNRRKSQNQPKITMELLQGSQQAVISGFYERSTSDLAPEVRTFIEDHLLTVAGFRDSVALENALGMGISEETIKKLVDRRLVRQEDRGGPKRLELTHDLLAGVVRASRDLRRQREAAEKEKAALLAEQERQKQELLKGQEEERQRLAKAQELERQERDRREMKRLRLRSLFAFGAAVLAIGMAAWAFRAEHQAKHDKEIIQQQLQDVQSAYSPALGGVRDPHSPTEYFDVQRPADGGAFRNPARAPASTPPPSQPPVVSSGKPSPAIAQETTAAALKPRVFIQIVNQADRCYAENLKVLLERKGCSVQGIQYIPQAAALSQSDVRFYRDADETWANKVLDILHDAGQKAARKYIPSGQKDNPNVRPNTFEVWLANGAGSGTDCPSKAPTN